MAKVLVVDDEQSIRESLSEFLKGDGHEVQAVSDGREAVKLLGRGGIDVVVSDIIMPNFTGMDLLEYVHKNCEDVQVIMLTGEPTVETASKALRKRAFDYLAKPISGRVLCQTVAIAYDFKRLKDEKRRLEEENQRIRRHLEMLVKERTAELAKANEDLHIEIRDRIKAQDDLQTSLDKLRKNLDETAHAISLAIEKRDPYTAGHQARVTKLAVAIAENMRLPGPVTDTIRLAASLHDVGKIAIPAEILSKPATLDAEETAMMRKHSRVGYEIVGMIEFPGPVAKIILQHHERWNGTGYPEGLRGESILPEARIIAVADVVEAMAHHRPYRPALGLAAALKHIEGGKKILYGPDAVEACLAVFKGGFAFGKLQIAAPHFS